MMKLWRWPMLMLATFAAGNGAVAGEPRSDTFSRYRNGMMAEALNDVITAQTAYQEACEQRLAAACTMAGLIQIDLASSEKDHAKAARLFGMAVSWWRRFRSPCAVPATDRLSFSSV